MRLFLHIVGWAVAGSAFSLILQYLFDPRPAFELAGTALFFLGFVASVYADREDPFASPNQVVLAPFAFVAFCLVLAIAGMLVISWSQVLGILLISPTALGYYPSGPDVPFLYGGLAWVISILFIIGGAMAVGALLRKRRAAPASHA